jgi:hypothetical protein
MANNQNKKLVVQKPDSNEKLQKLIEYLRGEKCNKFTGYIRINFNQGYIGRIEKFEEILKN